MKKHIIITGSKGTGKSLLSRLLFIDNDTFLIDGSVDNLKSSRFIFSKIPLNTKCIFIDEISSFNISFLFEILTSVNLIIDRQCLPVVTIPMPLIVFSISKDLLSELSQGVIRRCCILDTDTLTISELTKFSQENKLPFLV